jgi:uncharacterized protein
MEVEPTGMRELDRETCLQRLADHPVRVGRLAFLSEGYPVILPINYAIDRGTVVFKTSLGSKLDHVAGGASVAFEVDRVDADWLQGWSVLVQGRAAEVSELSEVARLRGLDLQTWAPGRRDRFVVITPERMTGREIVPPER